MSKAETIDGTNKLRTKEEKEAHYRETIARAEKMRERARQRPRDDPQRGFEQNLADSREYSARMLLARLLSNYRTGDIEDLYAL